MGLVNQCMNDVERYRVPSQIDSESIRKNGKQFYVNKYRNTERYNSYLEANNYQRTVIPASSHTNSTMYVQMEKKSNPPSDAFDKQAFNLDPLFKGFEDDKPLQKKSEMVVQKESSEQPYRVKKGGSSAPVNSSGHNFSKLKSSKQFSNERVNKSEQEISPNIQH